jgi:hypothetical protein
METNEQNSNNDVDQNYIDRLLKHQEQTKEKEFYGVKRIDVLIVSLSGAGIYIIFEMLKFFKEQDIVEKYNLCPLKVAGVLFAISIFLNFISQWTGYYANRFESDSTEITIQKEKKKPFSQVALNSTDANVTLFNRLTDVLNVSSTGCMLIGIIILTFFTLFIF